ncbi:hypothetical protein ACH5RR_024035 [Cinchona calisaya]|uniref:Uncharacterized protein n=1 Tax=Cinchona calisaya TaxID=153742 RepID=A0ABD2ZDH2_9GENT
MQEYIDWIDFTKKTKESVRQCLQIDYYGAKRATEALIPLLQLSESPRIVNVTSSMGTLELIPNGWAKGILSDDDNLTEERLDEDL